MKRRVGAEPRRAYNQQQTGRAAPSDYRAEHAAEEYQRTAEYRAYDDDAYDYPREDEEPWADARSRRLPVGALLLVLLAVGAGAVAFYGMFLDRTITQMPLTVSGLAVLGLTLALLAVVSARGTARLGRRGHGGRAVLTALLGGLCAIGASGSLAGAFVLGMLAASA